MRGILKCLLMAAMSLLLFAACQSAKDTVAITADRSMYSPAMSSSRGIYLTPNFKTKKKYRKVEYHWVTDEGEFISNTAHLGKDVKNQGGAVLWSAVENDKVSDIENPFDVRLEVVDMESGEVIASAKLTINPNKGFYEIKQ